MRTLKQVFESLVKSYNNQEMVNFIDVRDLDGLLKDSDLVKSLIDTYNKQEQINFLQLRDLEKLI